MAVLCELVTQKSVACFNIRQKPAASTGTRSVHSQMRCSVAQPWLGQRTVQTGGQHTLCTLSATRPWRRYSPYRQPDPASHRHPSRARRGRRSGGSRTQSPQSARPSPCTSGAVPPPAHTAASWGSAQASPTTVGSRGLFFTYQFTPTAGPVATQIGAPAAPDLRGRSFRSPVNTAQQRARRYRPNAAGWAPLGWSEKNRKVAISGVPARSGLGWLSARDSSVLPTSLETSLLQAFS